MSTDSKIAFVGAREYAAAMRFAGFECFGVSSPEEAKTTIQKLSQQNYVLIFVSRDIAPSSILVHNVVVLPGMTGKIGDGGLTDEITRAIGSEINLTV